MNQSGYTKLLNMKSIGKFFSGVRVLDSVDFDLESGEIHILAGENGAGKTTLIKILAGVHTDYKGQISLEGQTVRFKSPHDASMYGISAIHQEIVTLSSRFFTRENIEQGGEVIK